MNKTIKAPVRPPSKPRKKVVRQPVEAKPQKTKKPAREVSSDEWQEKKIDRRRKTNKFCVDCLDLETCVKEKLAIIMFCGDKRK